MTTDKGLLGKWRWLGRVNLDQELSPAARTVAFWMVEHRNSKTGLSFPSVKTLAGLTGLTQRSVQSARATLTERGYMKVEQRATGPKEGARYSIQMEGVHEISPLAVGNKVAEAMYVQGKGMKEISPIEREGVNRISTRGENQYQKGVHDISPKPTESNPLNNPLSNSVSNETGVNAIPNFENQGETKSACFKLADDIGWRAAPNELNNAGLTWPKVYAKLVEAKTMGNPRQWLGGVLKKTKDDRQLKVRSGNFRGVTGPEPRGDGPPT